MSLLEQLRQEAEQRRQVENALQREQERKARYYKEEMLPKMIETYNYLDELVKTINYLEREIRADYRLPGVCEFNGLKQVNYRLNVDSTVAMKRITLSFECKGEGESDLTVTGDRLIEQQVSQLLAYKLSFNQKVKTNVEDRQKETVFTIQHYVPVAMIVEANEENSVITVRVHNLPMLGVSRQTFKPEQFNFDFIDRLGRFVLRMDDKFLRQELSPERLKEIRRKLIREEKRRAKELGIKFVPPLQMPAQKGFLHRIKGGLRRILAGDNRL